MSNSFMKSLSVNKTKTNLKSEQDITEADGSKNIYETDLKEFHRPGCPMAYRQYRYRKEQTVSSPVWKQNKITINSRNIGNFQSKMNDGKNGCLCNKIKESKLNRERITLTDFKRSKISHIIKNFDTFSKRISHTCGRLNEDTISQILETIRNNLEKRNDDLQDKKDDTDKQMNFKKNDKNIKFKKVISVYNINQTNEADGVVSNKNVTMDYKKTDSKRQGEINNLDFNKIIEGNGKTNNNSKNIHQKHESKNKIDKESKSNKLSKFGKRRQNLNVLPASYLFGRSNKNNGDVLLKSKSQPVIDSKYNSANKINNVDESIKNKEQIQLNDEKLNNTNSKTLLSPTSNNCIEYVSNKNDLKEDLNEIKGLNESTSNQVKKTGKNLKSKSRTLKDRYTVELKSVYLNRNPVKKNN